MVNLMATRVDFKHVRQHAAFDRVLGAYSIELKKDGNKPGQFKALCPFHDDHKPSMKVNTERNIFHCFACEAKGNVLEFVRDMDGLGEDQLRQAALKVAELSGIDPDPSGRRPTQKRPAATEPPPPPPPAAETPADEELDGDPHNRVLTFELKLGQDDELSTWLTSRGLDPDQIDRFGLGRASARSKTIANRLAIPIYNAAGELVGYCGRYVGDEVPDDIPKYVLPKGFRKDLELFNQHRVPQAPDALVVFESYFSVMRHADWIAAVSPFGRSISPQQVAAIAALEPKRIFVVFDGDDPGRAGAVDVAGPLAAITWTRIVDLPNGQKPHRLTPDELRERLREAW